jgi:hypothetical protein
MKTIKIISCAQCPHVEWGNNQSDDMATRICNHPEAIQQVYETKIRNIDYNISGACPLPDLTEED